MIAKLKKRSVLRKFTSLLRMSTRAYFVRSAGIKHCNDEMPGKKFIIVLIVHEVHISVKMFTPHVPSQMFAKMGKTKPEMLSL